MKKILLVILQFICISLGLCAQEYYFRNYEVSDGVSNNTITCITQDQRGFMWFGTRNGLNRFDGTSFKVFRTNINNPQSIGSNSILSLFAGQHQQLWVGTYKGIYLYDEMHETFSRFEKIPPVEVRTIKADKNGQLWIIADNNLYRYDPVSQTMITYPPNNSPGSISISANGDVWTASSAGMIGKYAPVGDKFIGFDMAELCKQSGPLQTICPVGDTGLLIATLRSTFLFDIRTQQLTDIFKRRSSTGLQVHTIIQQTGDEFWLGAEDGLYILNINTGRTQHIGKQYGNPYALNDNVIVNFCRDKEGSTWVGTFSGGINFYSKQLNYFTKYFPGASINSLPGNLVHEICADRNNNLWVGTEDAGLNKVDAITGKITHFEPGKIPGSISYSNIHGLLADGNELWIGTLTHGIDILDLRTEKVIRHYEQDGRANWLNSNFIVTMYKTKAGDILVGTWEGLLKYNRNTDNFSPMPFFNRQVQAIHEDSGGTLWVCSYGNGVYYYNPTTGLKGSLQHDTADIHSLPNNYINNMFEDSRHNIWFCTENGLCRFDQTSGKVIRYTDDPLLQNNQVFRILEDNAGTLWISTSKGLVNLDPLKKSSHVFHTVNGLLSEQFNYNSAYKAHDGRLYFGSVKGMISFNPAAFEKTGYKPAVFITNIQVNNHDWQPIRETNQLPLAIPFATNIQLSHDSSTISFEVAALSYTLPNTNEYMYTMEGLDHEWTHIKNNRKIYYTNLPPGDYTFKVRAGSNGVWNNVITSLNIHISPPFWVSGWAWILYTLLAAIILFIILRYYYMAIHEKNQRKIKTLEIEKEREIYNAKIDFFTNITHEIKTPLTLIKLPVEKLTRMTAKDSPAHEQLDMINKNTTRLIHLTDQLLDFRKAEANNYSLSFVRTDITGLLKDLFATHKPAAEEKNISLKLELPRIALQAYVDAEAFRKILSNLFSNAIKYADTTVIVRLHAFNSDDRVFHIECKNDGNLIPYEMKEKIFEPFYRMKETEKSTGTGIGLPLARSLAELHKGVLDLKQPVNSFNSFLLSIPIHQENEITLNDYETFETVNNVNITPEPVAGNNTGRIEILLVEDNKDILHFLQMELNQHYHTYKAYNGQEALEILKQENIQLVISDLMMPVMDGIELCRRIKTDIQFSHIPIIILTAKNTLTAKIEGLETGADAFIEKPFSLEHLQVQVTNLLNNRNIIKDYYAHSPLAHIKGIASTKADKNFLEALQQLIDQNITDKDLDVETLSKMMNMSRGTFYRKIKGLSNLTPNELINVSRLKKAAELLAEGTYKINEVANIVGYNLNSNFSRDFHKQFDVTPSQYIKNLVQE